MNNSEADFWLFTTVKCSVIVCVATALLVGSNALMVLGAAMGAYHWGRTEGMESR